MGRLVIDDAKTNTFLFDVDSFLIDKPSLSDQNKKEVREAIVMFKTIVGNNINEDGTITYNGDVLSVDELYNSIIEESYKERRTNTEKIVEDYISSFKMFDGSLINNGVSFDIVDDMKKRAFESYDYDSKTVSYVNGRRLTLDELYLKYRAVDIEEQNELSNAELCADMLNYIDDQILDSNIDGMDVSVRDYITNTVPTLMHNGTNVEINGEIIPIQVFIKKIVDHQFEYLTEQEKIKMQEKDDELNRTNENPGLVGLINVALRDSDLEVTTEMPVHASSILSDDELSSLIKTSNISDDFVDNYYYSQISKLRESINKTTSEQDLLFNEKKYKEIVGNIPEEKMDDKTRLLIETVNELITSKRNGFIKLNINSEDLIDITHGIINEWKSELSGITSSDQFNELYGKVSSLYVDFTKKGIKDTQLDATIISFLGDIEKRRIIFDATLTNISQELQKIKFGLDEQMKRIRREILAIECSRTELNQLSGKIIMINHLIGQARTDVLNASHNHKFSDYNDKFTNDSLNYYLSQLDMYTVALDNVSKIGYGYR